MLAGRVRRHTRLIFSITDPHKSLHCIEIGPIISKQNAVEWYLVFENRPSFSRLCSQLQSREWFTGVTPVSCGHFLCDEVELGIINSSYHLSFSVPPSGFRSLSDLISMHMSFATSLHEKVLRVFYFILLKMVMYVGDICCMCCSSEWCLTLLSWLTLYFLWPCMVFKGWILHLM